jgi:acyl carrier protein
VRLEQLVGDVFEIEPSHLDDSTSPTSLDRWDSLGHLSLISAVEETYDVFLSTSEMREARSIGALRQILATKGVAA